MKFIPRPIVIGFTNGIALLIASTQIKDFLGLGSREVPSEFFARMKVLGEYCARSNRGYARAGRWRRSPSILAVPTGSPRIPGTIVALLAGTAAVVISPAGGNHRHALRRHSGRACRPLHIPAFRAGPDSAAVALGLHGGDPGARWKVCSRPWWRTA